MKIVFVLFSVFILSCSLFAQPVFKKQISFLDFDVRNPSFIENGEYGYNWFWYYHQNALVFEGYKNPSKPQIYSLLYNIETDSFYNPRQLTFSKGSCINPSGLVHMVGNIGMFDKIVWQTNENGNWDIAYGVMNSNDSLFRFGYIASDSLDEINPRLITSYYNGGNVFGVTYEKAGSIYLNLVGDSSIITEKIFDATDSYEYESSCAAVAFEFPFMKYYGTAIAVKKYQDGRRRIVYKSKNENTQLWSDEKYLYDSLTTTVTPNLFGWRSGFFISFQTIVDGKRKLKYFWDTRDFGHPELAENISDSTYETFNFSMKSIEIITNRLAKSFHGSGQNIYQVKKEEKNYLYPSFHSDFNYPPKDSLIELKLSEPKVTTGIVGYKNQAIWAYSVWEDSSNNGTIQLFGSSGAYQVGGIEDETSPQDFTLYQNYPNPFNPETVISFQLLVRSNVSLKVFDVLGREVATLVNEEKPAGEYQVLFNNQLTTNHRLLSSGVLFYQLKVGNQMLTRSMLLLK